jgi:hypothetical protein
MYKRGVQGNRKGDEGYKRDSTSALENEQARSDGKCSQKLVKFKATKHIIYATTLALLFLTTQYTSPSKQVPHLPHYS